MSDFTAIDHGSILLLRPNTPAAEVWANEYLPDDRLTLGNATVIEPRYFGAILDGIFEDGLTVDALG